MTDDTYGTKSFTRAQQEMRRAFEGVAGQLVSGIIWLPAGILLLLRNH